MAVSQCTRQGTYWEEQHVGHSINRKYDGYTRALTYKHARELLVEYLLRADRPIFLLGCRNCCDKKTLLEDLCRTGDLSSAWRVLQPVSREKVFTRPPQNLEIWIMNNITSNYQKLFEEHDFNYYMIDMNDIRPRRTHSQPRAISIHEVVQHL